MFFIFLYQRWIYKVDHKRVNEFGFSGEMEDNAKKQIAVTEPQQQQQPISGAIEAAPPKSPAKGKSKKQKKTD